MRCGEMFVWGHWPRVSAVATGADIRQCSSAHISLASCIPAVVCLISVESRSIFLGLSRSIEVLFWYVATSFLQRFPSGLFDPEVKRAKWFLLEFYLDQNAERAYRVSSEVPLIPEVRLLQTLQGLFDRSCVLHKPVHLGHWLAMSECGHFPQSIVRPGARGMMRQWRYMFTLCCLTSFFFISSTDCSSAVGSIWVGVHWDVNKKSLIVSWSCRSCLCSTSFFFFAQ